MARRLRNLALATAALLPLGIGFAVAGPNGGTVVGGGATIGGQGTSNVTINQSTPRAIINWHTFNIGTGETTTFNQPDSSSVALNRVTGGLGPSNIDGTLNANGRVFIVNRDGILFGPGAVINTSGFLATTNDISNADFMAGRYNFNIPGRPDASIVNHGTITAHNAGFAALVAPGVRNTGTITATLGTVGLASGNSFTLDFYGDRLITLAVGDSIGTTVRDVETGKPLSSLVENTGRLRANGGRVELTAAAARQVVDSVINTSGVVEANRIGTRGGTIVLSAATAATKGAGARKQTVRVSGTLSASGKRKGETAGKVVVTSEDIRVAGARIDVSGSAGGGTALIGGDWGGGNPNTSLVSHPRAKLEIGKVSTAATVTIDSATVIDTSATDSGSGGKVVVWSDQSTSFAGLIEARGGTNGGNGGFVEVSGRQLDYKGTTDLRAPMGTVGTLLLDPADYYIFDAKGQTPPEGASAITNVALQDQLERGNVVIATNGTANPQGQKGDIFVNASVAWSTNNLLTLSAHNNIAFNAAISAANGGLTLDAAGGIAAMAAVNVGTFTLRNGAWNQVASTFPTSTLPAFAATDFRIEGGSFLRALGGDGSSASPYQITDVYGLQGVGSSSTLLSQNFVLANDVNARGTANWNGGHGFVPIGGRFTFFGAFDGKGHTIGNLTIAPTDGNTNSIGLFASLGAGSTVRDLNLFNVNVTADPKVESSSQFLGTLAGQNAGQIFNVSATGSVNGLNLTGVIAGGLVGRNKSDVESQSTALIQQSHAGVNVSIGNGAGQGGGWNYAGGLAVTVSSSGRGDLVAGGLVGENTGEIANSYATGAVTSTGSDIITLGGLAGYNAGTITNSHASGDVKAKDPASFALAILGGLVGGNEGEINDSQASGNVSANNGFVFAGGFVGFNLGAITNTLRFDSAGNLIPDAAGSVTLADASTGVAGGFAGANFNFISQSVATGEVKGGDGGFLGGFSGWNAALISQSYATGPVEGGDSSFVGGFAALNLGEIRQSVANQSAVNGAVTGGANSVVGGLVAVNIGILDLGFLAGDAAGPQFTQFQPGLISQSYATGAVTGGANSTVGGLVGMNGGAFSLPELPTITAACNACLAPQNASASAELGSIANSYATGAVNGGLDSTIGGLVGANLGSIIDSHASGTVANRSDPEGPAFAGGLVGENFGSIANSHAVGPVGTLNPVNTSYATYGGLVGFNYAGGTISQSFATGNVAVNNSAAGGTVDAGGLVGANAGTITTSHAEGSVNVVAGFLPFVGGLVGWNQAEATVSGSQASGIVVVSSGGADAIAGGLVGVNDGTVANASASGSVTGGDGSILGGLAGENTGTISDAQSSSVVTGAGQFGTIGGLAGINDGTIARSGATGAVVGGAFSFIGGLVGNNLGTITESTALGAVSGGDNSFVGGLAGWNIGGTIAQSSARGGVTGGDGSFVGGLVGFNFGGLVDRSFASGNVTGGDTSFLGGLVAANVGTIAQSFASGAVTGGDGSQVGGLVAVNFTPRISGRQPLVRVVLFSLCSSPASRTPTQPAR
jgi:filamentous hemagglutinin family protein